QHGTKTEWSLAACLFVPGPPLAVPGPRGIEQGAQRHGRVAPALMLDPHTQQRRAPASPCSVFGATSPCPARTGFSIRHYTTVSSPAGGVGGRRLVMFRACRTW